MNMVRLGWVCLVVWVGSSSVFAQYDPEPSADDVTIRFDVQVPADTPAAVTVYLCGDHALFGNWDGRGLELQRGYDGRYTGRVSVERGAVIQYKATRGSWETVEKNLAGGEIANRQLVADQDREVALIVEAWAAREQVQARAEAESTLTGDIRRHAGFRSDILENERTLIVYLPPGYDEEEAARYPVLYMHDGQNLFDARTSFAHQEWGVDETAQRLIEAGRIEPIIIVGIYNNADRMTEYTPRPEGDLTDAYSRFVVQEVKPFIDTTYRTDPAPDRTGVAGSSLGGLISLYMVWAHADTFGRCAGLSPSLFWQERWLIEQWRASDMAWSGGKRLWIDIGTREGRKPEGGDVTSAVQNVRDLAGLFDAAGLRRSEDYAYLEVQGGEHNERAWSRRIDLVLLYLYGRDDLP